MTRVAPTERFPYRWETDVPMKPCPDPGCAKLHGGHVAVGSDAPRGGKEGAFLLGIVSDLGNGALRLTPEEAMELMDDFAIAFAVMIGMDTSDAIGMLSDIKEDVARAFDEVEKEISDE